MTTKTTTTETDLVITRVFNARRELVFKAWTDPKAMVQWWGPRGFTTPLCESDPRPGGAIRIHMRAPDGRIYPSVGTYHEVVEPERVVATTSVLDAEGNELLEVLNTVTFLEHADGTELTLRAHVVKSTPQAAPMLAGMKEGWRQTLDRLGEFLARH